MGWFNRNPSYVHQLVAVVVFCKPALLRETLTRLTNLYQTLWRWHLPVDPWRMGVAYHWYPHQATPPLLAVSMCVPHYLQPPHVCKPKRAKQPTSSFSNTLLHVDCSSRGWTCPSLAVSTTLTCTVGRMPL